MWHGLDERNKVVVNFGRYLWHKTLPAHAMRPNQLRRVHVTRHRFSERLGPMCGQHVQQALGQQAPEKALLRQGPQTGGRQPPLLSPVCHLQYYCSLVWSS